MIGRIAPPLRPTTPTDPTLISRPVPRKRTFSIRSFGPSTAVDTSVGDGSRWGRDARKTWWRDFYREAGPCEYDDRENLPNLDRIEGSEAISWREDDFLVPQPTWGYYVFLTDYEQATRESFPRAMENWVRLIQRQQGANANPSDPYAEEVFRRFKLDLVYDQESLDSASPDRVRQCFRALFRSLEITDDEDNAAWVPPTRNQVCFVLNADSVQMLANLAFRNDNKHIEEYCAFEACQVQAVDIKWQRPEETNSKYRGWGNVSIVNLPRMYFLFDDEGLEGSFD